MIHRFRFGGVKGRGDTTWCLVFGGGLVGVGLVRIGFGPMFRPCRFGIMTMLLNVCLVIGWNLWAEIAGIPLATSYLFRCSSRLCASLSPVHIICRLGCMLACRQPWLATFLLSKLNWLRTRSGVEWGPQQNLIMHPLPAKGHTVRLWSTLTWWSKVRPCMNRLLRTNACLPGGLRLT